jgi:ADP-ribose diphosphatase
VRDNENMNSLPIIHSRQLIESDYGKREVLELEFSNGARRRYERSIQGGNGAVMIAAMPDEHTVLLIKEYAAGTHRYELCLPKGKIDNGETILQAANRELKEEVGFGAHTLHFIRSITQAPTYMTHAIELVLAQDLYAERLVGDEPEQLEVIPWRLDRLHELLSIEACSEGRSLAALLIIKEMMARRHA